MIPRKERLIIRAETAVRVALLGDTHLDGRRLIGWNFFDRFMKEKIIDKVEIAHL